MGDEQWSELVTLLTTADPAIEDGLLHLSHALRDPNDPLTEEAGSDEIIVGGRRRLDDLAQIIRAAGTARSAELAASNEPGIDQIVQGIFVDAGFVGDVEHYHSEDNSFLDRVLIRRVGMPITLSAVVVAVARRLDIDLHLLGLPGHVVVGIPGDNDTFIDAFGGVIVDRPAIEQRLRSIFGRPMAIGETSLTPMKTTDVVARVCNNLMRTWSDEAEKFDRLLEVRVRLPMGASEHSMLLEIAEARARFDLAAMLRESADPTDPEIDALWGKLN